MLIVIQGKQTFTYIDSTTGVNQDGEKYFAINVITKNDKRKLSFVAKKPDVLDKIVGLKFIDFQDIELSLEFDRIFNPEKRTSYWNCELIGIGNNRINEYSNTNK